MRVGPPGADVEAGASGHQRIVLEAGPGGGGKETPPLRSVGGAVFAGLVQPQR